MDDPIGAIGKTIAMFYAAFDNREARRPAFDQLRGLFIDGARITRADPAGVESWTVDEFIVPREALLTDGRLTDFHEWETSATTKTFGALASRSSFYEKDGVLDGRPYHGAGHKLTHLINVGGMWRISAILWRDLA